MEAKEAKDQPDGEIEVRGILKIGQTKDGLTVIDGEIGNKKLCLNVLADAIKFINNHDGPRIVKPSGGLINRLRQGKIGGNGRNG